MRINFNAGGPPSGPFGKIFATLVGLLTLAAALMFSVVFVAVIAVLGLIAWGYFWWKTRALRKQLREQQAASPFGQAPAPESASGEVIEGEAVRVVDEQNRISG